MSDVFSMLAKLKRPRILIRAARIGAMDYNRDRSLRRLLRLEPAKASERVISALMECEAEMNAMRLSNSAAYQVSRHVEVVTALICEARLLRASQKV